MANYKFDLLRSNGNSYDTLYPKTIIAQVDGLSDALAAKVSTSALGAISGVATLDSNKELTASQIPSWLLNGQPKPMGALAENKIMAQLVATITNYMTAHGITDANTLAGSYFIVEGNIQLDWTNAAYPAPRYYLSPGDEGDESAPVDLEKGDMVVLKSYLPANVGASESEQWNFFVINNSYALATSGSPGIVTLSGITSIPATATNSVITENILKGLIGPGPGKISQGDHAHSGIYQPLDSDLTKIAGLSPTNGNFIVGSPSGWVAESGATARASLGLTINEHVQGYDAGLASLAALGSAADKMIYSTGKDTWAELTTTSTGRGLLGISDAAAGRTALGLVIGTNVQAYNAQLAAIAGLAVTDGNIIVGNGTTWVAESGSVARASLGVYSTTEISNMLANRPNIYYDIVLPDPSTYEGAFFIANVASA